jgi:hypothetical protein
MDLKESLQDSIFSFTVYNRKQCVVDNFTVLLPDNYMYVPASAGTYDHKKIIACTVHHMHAVFYLMSTLSH